MPSLSVVQTVPSRRRNEAPALSSPANPSDPSSSPGTNHLKPTGTSTSVRPSMRATRSMMLLLTIVLPTAAPLRPIRPASEKVEDGRRQVVVRVHEPRASDDAVAVAVGIIRDGDVEPILQRDQVGHRMGRRAIHADSAIPVERHRAESGVDFVIDHLDRHAITLRDSMPVGETCSTERIDADAQAGAGNGTHVDDRREVAHVSAQVIVRVRRRRVPRTLIREPWHARDAVREQLVGPILNRARHRGSGGAARRGVVLEPAIFRRIVRRRHDDAIGQQRRPAAIVA